MWPQNANHYSPKTEDSFAAFNPRKNSMIATPALYPATFRDSIPRELHPFSPSSTIWKLVSLFYNLCPKNGDGNLRPAGSAVAQYDSCGSGGPRSSDNARQTQAVPLPYLSLYLMMCFLWCPRVKEHSHLMSISSIYQPMFVKQKIWKNQKPTRNSNIFCVPSPEGFVCPSDPTIFPSSIEKTNKQAYLLLV